MLSKIKCLVKMMCSVPFCFFFLCGCSGGLMVLGKLPGPGRPTISKDSRARA